MAVGKEIPRTEAQAGFDPLSSPDRFQSISGGRRKLGAPVASIKWNWPADRKDQFQAFDDWHDIAMQILHRANAGFRLMAVYKKVIRWKEGCIWSSDDELARDAGHCYWKTISREVALHRSLGIITVEHGWRVCAGKRLRTRIIRPSIPTALDPEIVIRDLKSLPFEPVTRGPYETEPHTVTRGPNHTVTRGPITIDTIEEGASRNASA